MGELYDGLTVRQFRQEAERAGLQLSVMTDSPERAVLQGRLEGVEYEAVLRDPGERGKFGTVQFYTAFRARRDRDRINTWNAAMRFAKAYWSGDQQVFLELDLLLYGVGRAYLQGGFDAWRWAIPDFVNFLETR